MANPPDITQIPAPRVDFIDKRTGLMAREWYRFFVNIYNIAGGGNSAVSLDDVQVSPSGGASYDSIAEMMKTLQELEIQPPVVPSTGGGTTYSVFTSTTNGLAPASGGGTVNYLRADGTWATPPGTGGVTFANPTALVGSTAVNGVATTVMRSDAAPAIDLTANYTYTGQWTFSRTGTTSALNIYANATTYQCALGFASSAEFKMDIASSATGLGVYVTGTKYLAVTAGNVDVPAGTLTVASTSVRDGGILTSGTVNAARLPTFGTAAAGIVPASGGGTTNFLRADGTWAAAGGGTAANPTASLGLTAINGVATTYMRSDAAPALDVTIAPTWSGLHTFSQRITNTSTTSGSAATGAYTYGTLGYSDSNNLVVLQSSVNAYNQLVLQNTNVGAAASADLTISNNNGTATTFYGNFGMNSSGWAGTAGTATFNAPNVVYLTAASGDLALGTITSNPIRFVVNSGADAAIIDTSSRLGIGVASPTAMLHLKAGTATASTGPLKFNSGTNLTTAEAGSCEYDGNNFYKTVDTTHGRNVTSVLQQFILTANGSALSGATQNVFGATSAASLAASSTYEIECYCHFVKTTAGTVQWIPTWSTAVTMAHSYLEYTPVTGFTVTPATGAMLNGESTVLTATNTAIPATASLTSGVNHIAKIKIFVTTNTACNFRLNNTIGTGSITMQAGSYYTVRKVVSTAGNFVA